MARIILLNKPYDMLTQFTDADGRATLADCIDNPRLKQFYPAGRLDRDSEGLVVLTDNGQLQAYISSPKHKLLKRYWVQVEGEISEEALTALRSGLELKDGMTKPAEARVIEEPELWDRSKPVRFRKNIPTTWIELGICEGRNRQVRRMTAAAGFPTLRLVRFAVGEWTLDNAKPGSRLRPGEYAVKEFAFDAKAAPAKRRDYDSRQSKTGGNKRGSSKRPTRRSPKQRPFK